MISQKKNTVAQRISSARLHKIKELKNEIFDLQHKLEASSLENRFLKELECRHMKAIDSYENSESSLPDLLTNHYNEVRDLRELLRMSQKKERNTSRKLRKVEAELQKAKDACQTLHMLSEDKALEEREELDYRLSVFREKMEENDKRIQSLEKQLELNNNTFSRLLANVNRKALEAGIITKNLQMEINSLHHKIKEKNRQLSVKNIYANRMPKIPKDGSYSVPYKKSLSINKSIQVDKQSFRSLLLSQYQTQETAKSPIHLTKGENSSEDKNLKANANEAYTDAQHGTENLSTKKILKLETFNITPREYLREGKLLVEDSASLEFTKEEKERDLLEQELKKIMKTEQTLPSDSVKESNQEEDAVEESEKEEKKPDEQLSNSEKAGSKCVTPGPKTKTPTCLKKKYTFSEATENLHDGLPASGTKSSLFNKRHTGHNCSETPESKVKNSFGLHEPSCGKITKTRHKCSSTEAEGYTHMTFADRKTSRMKELFGPSCV
ncbi:lebercilin-like protein [Phaethornis superciliosus]